MRNPDMVHVLKMEYVSKINIFGLNMMVKSGLEKLSLLTIIVGYSDSIVKNFGVFFHRH